jgi:hypothetical protein
MHRKFHSFADCETYSYQWQTDTFVAHSLNKFRFAKQSEFGQLDEFDEPAGAEPHQSAKTGLSPAARQQRLFPPQNALKPGIFNGAHL